MYSHCIHCHRALGSNEHVPEFPVGRQLAVDAERGRLWVICPSCARWNLSPLEERWEAVETCERLYRDTRLRVATDNIGLARLPGGFELVRIGKATRPELAAWRYGPQLLRRYRTALPRLAARELWNRYTSMPDAVRFALLLAGPGIVPALVHPALALLTVPATVVASRIRARQRLSAIVHGDERLTVRRRHLASVRLETSADESDVQLVVPHDHGTATLRGDRALGALASLLVHVNGSGGSRRDVELATRKLDYFGSPEALLKFAARAASVPALGHQQRLAVEMAVHESRERQAMEGELAVLEAAWREAEELAAIADNLIAAPEADAKLDRLRVQQTARDY